MNPKGNVDPFEIGNSFLKVYASWLQDFPGFLSGIAELNQSLLMAGMQQFHRFHSNGSLFKKPAGDEKAAFIDFVKQSSMSARSYHTIFSRWLYDVIDRAPGVGDADRQRSRFWAVQIVNALAPSNYFWTNPGAVQRFMQSQGESLQKGLCNWLEDVERGENPVRLVDDTEFKVGGNIAATPGHVVFRNELLELIRYEPVTETTYDVPVIFIQPWINKYYIFDLSQENSFVQYLLKQGFTVFITSWKNPTPAMRHITFDDYVFKGALAAIDAAREICGVNQVHAAGYCIGGTALAALMAWLNQEYGQNDNFPVADWTMLASMTDFSEPGDISVFLGEPAIEAVENLMEADGFLDAKLIGLSFRMLKSDSLIWRYVVNNYLYGEMPPKSDMLYWNSDGTRLPEAMCSFYLREFYLKNKLIQKNGIVLGNRTIDLGCIRQPLYAVGAQQDHISPWKGTFRTCNLVQGDVRYVLASEGHITGIVNPPSARSKKKYWAGETGRDSEPDAWFSKQQEQRGSWWPEWVEWLSKRCLPKDKPPPLESKAYPSLGRAPGSYVLEK